MIHLRCKRASLLEDARVEVLMTAFPGPPSPYQGGYHRLPVGPPALAQLTPNTRLLFCSEPFKVLSFTKSLRWPEGPRHPHLCGPACGSSLWTSLHCDLDAEHTFCTLPSSSLPSASPGQLSDRYFKSQARPHPHLVLPVFHSN